ncbi:MAG: RNA polymerase sigma factor [Blastocatellia bacterium]
MRNKFSPETLFLTPAAGLAGWTGLQLTTFSPAPERTLPDEAASQNFDDALVERILAGDDEAFEQIVARHSRRVFAIARKFFRSPETVEDIAQETFVKAFASLASYRQGASFERWLARIAVNNCYDELRRRRKRGESLLADVTDDEAAWIDSKLAGVSFELHLGKGAREIAGEIAEKLLAQLSPESRLVLVLLHAEEYSSREIAQMMGWSEAKVKTKAFRARHQMRRALERLKLTEKRKIEGRAAAGR